jgi:hypothetical protein
MPAEAGIQRLQLFTAKAPQLTRHNPRSALIHTGLPQAIEQGANIASLRRSTLDNESAIKIELTVTNINK